MNRARIAVLGMFAAACSVVACEADGARVDMQTAEAIAAALTTACPVTSASDEDARASCSAMLSGNELLASVMRNPFLWGGQKPGTSYHPEESNMNWFNSYVFRRMYLSLMMFPGDHTVEQTTDGLTVVHMAVQFRNELAMGSYPYPFWHSDKKWQAYQFSREFVVVIQNGTWIGAMRSVEQDTSRPFVSHTWSGQWQWEASGNMMPYVSLYSYLFSPSNPNVARLDSAYRALSQGLRDHSCTACHSPDNHAGITPLEFFNYPNQALTARNAIIARLQSNDMPPPSNDLGLPSGIVDDGDRQELIGLANEFKDAGDAALAFERVSPQAPIDTQAALAPRPSTGTPVN